MARGLITITAITSVGTEQFELTLNDSTGIVVGDTIGARLPNGAGAIYRVSALGTGNIIIITDDLVTSQRTTSIFSGPVEPDFDGPSVPSVWEGELELNSFLSSTIKSEII